MKVIDLLNNIANGEEVPEKFKFAGQTFEKQGSYIDDEDGDSILDSMCPDFSNINEEIEIIEEERFSKTDKIEKVEIEPLNIKNDLQRQIELVHYENIMLCDKINEIIDKINEE